MGKYKVLIFGNKTYGGNKLDIISDLYEITWQRFPPFSNLNYGRASDYSYIIVDYSLFYEGRGYQEIFEKQLFEALSDGATIVFLYYDEQVPRYYNYSKQKWSTEECFNTQIGFRFIFKIEGRVFHIDKPVHLAEIYKPEFKNYLSKWGSSRNYFEGNFDDVIQKENHKIFAFSHKFENGLLMYLPCLRNYFDPTDLTNMFQTLIESLITYTTRIREEIPEWANEPIFEEEKKLSIKKERIKKELEELEKKIEPYKKAKVLAFSKEYNLEKDFPEFLKEQLGLKILQEERYKEDFWVLDDKNKKIAICEVKSYIRGFSRNGVYSIYNHREENKLDESFPAILFVNAHLNAPDWDHKLTPIAPQDYQVASSNNVLVVRIEDILFMWDAFRQGKITREEILKLFLSKKGWLYFKPDGKYEIRE